MHTMKDIEILFANQAVPLKEVVIVNIEKDRKMNKVCSSKQLPVPTPPNNHQRLVCLPYFRMYGSG